jgi:hypothetical protein
MTSGLAGLLGAGGGPAGAPALPVVTSNPTGSPNDSLRSAVVALQDWLGENQDDQDAAKVTKCLAAVQQVLADHAKAKDAALGVTPALQHVRRQSRAGY